MKNRETINSSIVELKQMVSGYLLVVCKWIFAPTFALIYITAVFITVIEQPEVQSFGPTFMLFLPLTMIVGILLLAVYKMPNMCGVLAAFGLFVFVSNCRFDPLPYIAAELSNFTLILIGCFLGGGAIMLAKAYWNRT